MTRLNVGCGDNKLPGYANIDIKEGQPAYPLPYTDASVDEIRCSHMLEHLTFVDASKAVTEFFRVLKPGGLIKLAVPDVDKIAASKSEKRLFWLMGGQLNEHDIHKSAYDEARLEALLHHHGFVDIEEWQSSDPDCSSMDISLNRQAIKPSAEQPAKRTATVKVGAYLTLPRYEAVAARTIMEAALKPMKIDLTTTQGVFWGQCMQRMFKDAVDKNLDWILSLDSDSLFTTAHLRHLFDVFAQTPQADAMAALQCRRGSGYPLMTTGSGVQDEVVAVDGSPIKVTTAHFGLTLIRVSSLRDVPRPWFRSEPGPGGEWCDERLDDDIWFWHQWRLAGKTIYVAPSCSIGHLEETVACFDDHMRPKHVYVHEWRKENGL